MSRSITISPIEGGASLMVAWRLEHKRVLVVGGGKVAAGRVRLALEADAHVTVVAPELGVELRRRLEAGELHWEVGPFEAPDLDGHHMVLVAIDDAEESARIAREARRRHIPVNVADVPELCDFWFNSVFRDGPLQVAVSTGGQGPSIAARLVREIGASIPREVGRGITRFGALRARVRATDPGAEASPRRMRWLAEIGRTWPYERLAALADEQIDALVRVYHSGKSPTDEVRSSSPQLAPGRIRLVGAGPGAPGLLTVDARAALESADLVIADQLIAPEILELVKGELRIANKHPGRSTMAQREIETWAIEAAKAGLEVVRLKQGDPFVYGRAPEELTAFAEAGIETEVLAGISSVTAAPLSANIPLTHREVADRFLVITGQGAEGRWIDLPAYHEKTTLVLLMAVSRAGEIAEQLMALGHPRDEPVAIIERATQPDQRTTRTRLDELESSIRSGGVLSPAVIVIGRVVEASAAVARGLEERAA